MTINLMLKKHVYIYRRVLIEQIKVDFSVMHDCDELNEINVLSVPHLAK
jgi:hypothetical protein